MLRSYLVYITLQNSKKKSLRVIIHVAYKKEEDVQVAKVSFGSVVAVSGNYNKIEKMNSRLRINAQKGDLMMKDVTKQYVNAPSSGLIAQAAQKGDRVEIYITGKEDVAKVKNKDPQWDTIDGVLTHLSSYYNINKMSIGEAMGRIFNS